MTDYSPCPFCGCRTELLWDNVNNKVAITCLACGARSDYMDSEQDAVKNWADWCNTVKVGYGFNDRIRLLILGCDEGTLISYDDLTEIGCRTCDSCTPYTARRKVLHILSVIRQEGHLDVIEKNMRNYAVCNKDGKDYRGLPISLIHSKISRAYYEHMIPGKTYTAYELRDFDGSRSRYSNLNTRRVYAILDKINIAAGYPLIHVERDPTDKFYLFTRTDNYSHKYPKMWRGFQ